MNTTAHVNPLGWHVMAQTPDGWMSIYFFGRKGGRDQATQAAAKWFQPTALVYARSMDIAAGHAYRALPKDAFGEQVSICKSTHACGAKGGAE